MFHILIRKAWLVAALLVMAMTQGCDDNANQIARQAADRQAQQNTAMGDLNKEVAAGSHQLVEADAKARQELVSVHRDLLAERSRLDTGWNQLEDERRQIATQRRIESTFVSVSKAAGCLLLVTTVLGFCWYAVAHARGEDASDSQLSEILLSEVLSDHASLLSASDDSLLGNSNPDHTP